MHLNSNEELSLPGGWRNNQGSGHAMIYQFQKTSEKKLLFSIYNTGARIGEHEKISSKQTERYSPVKTYELSEKPNKEG